jgi:hypothetical protein
MKLFSSVEVTKERVIVEKAGGVGGTQITLKKSSK